MVEPVVIFPARLRDLFQHSIEISIWYLVPITAMGDIDIKRVRREVLNAGFVSHPGSWRQPASEALLLSPASKQSPSEPWGERLAGGRSVGSQSARYTAKPSS